MDGNGDIMCEFCSKHKMKKWFLDPESYEDKLLENKKRKNVLQKIVGWGHEYYMRDSADAMNLVNKLPLDLGKHILNSRYITRKIAQSQHAGQVVTLEDALEIIDLSDNHVIFPCFCRKSVGLKEKDCCINFGPIKDLCKVANPKEKMEEIDTKEAKLRLREWHLEGLVHQVLYAAAPFPIALCNCERKYCLPMKDRLIFGIKSALLKGHEVAFVDPLKCKCGEFSCITKCQFGGMYVDIYDNKVVIDPAKCFGCGLCVTVCRDGAISLKSREETLDTRIRW